MDTIVIDRRFCGPPNSGNGGYVCGILARHIGPSAEVTLRRPPPLDTPLRVVRRDDAVELRDGETVVATGRAVELQIPSVPTASYAEAEDAASRGGVKFAAANFTFTRPQPSAGVLRSLPLSAASRA